MSDGKQVNVHSSWSLKAQSVDKSRQHFDSEFPIKFKPTNLWFKLLDWEYYLVFLQQ